VQSVVLPMVQLHNSCPSMFCRHCITRLSQGVVFHCGADTGKGLDKWQFDLELGGGVNGVADGALT
jgi:hypothetical protein